MSLNAWFLVGVSPSTLVSPRFEPFSLFRCHVVVHLFPDTWNGNIRKSELFSTNINSKTERGKALTFLLPHFRIFTSLHYFYDFWQIPNRWCVHSSPFDTLGEMKHLGIASTSPPPINTTREINSDLHEKVGCTFPFCKPFNHVDTVQSKDHLFI